MPQNNPNEIYQITSVTALAPKQKESDIIDAKDKNGTRKKITSFRCAIS